MPKLGYPFDFPHDYSRPIQQQEHFLHGYPFDYYSGIPKVTAAYIGSDDGEAMEVLKAYIGGKNGKAKRVIKAYIGDENGKAKLCFQGF